MLNAPPVELLTRWGLKNNFLFLLSLTCVATVFLTL